VIQDYKIISLKQIVQQMLVATGISADVDLQLRLRGELSLGNIAFADPVSRYDRSLFHVPVHHTAPRLQHRPQTADLAAYAQRVRSEW
jgi:hypothetical protein